MDNVMHLTYSSAISDFRELNSSFDAGIMRIAYADRNRNQSFISKETYEKCMHTIYNCPIVCNYDRETDTIGGHDVEVVRGQDGRVHLVNATTPVGVVPESATPYWETVLEEDGSTHEYLCVNVLLWKRQEAYRKIKEDGIESESMEIAIKDGGTDDTIGCFVIRDFEFKAFCILGDGIAPCFESASIELFSCSDMKSQMQRMMEDLKETFSLIDSPDGVIDIQNETKGGETLDEKMAVIEEYGADLDSLDFAINDFTADELRAKFEAKKRNGVLKQKSDDVHESDENTEPAADHDPVDGLESNDGAKPEYEPESEPKKDKSVATYALAGQLQDALVEAISVETVETCFGEISRYWFVDYDHSASMVYCYDENDWRLYGFQYSMDGDNVIVDFDSKRRMKYTIVEFDEGEQAVPFAAVFEHMATKYSENDTQWSQKYQSVSDQIDSLQSDLEELNELRKFKQDAEDASAQAERDRVLDQFEELVGIEAFDKLREDCSNYDIDALEEKCYAIKGRYGSQANFALGHQAHRLVVEPKTNEKEPYGGLFEKYGQKD